jgi:hypothetical protein
MKTLIGYLYIASLLTGLAGLWFSVVPTVAYVFGRFDGDFIYRPLETFIYKEGLLLLLSLGILMLAHIGTNAVSVFDEESTEKKKGDKLNNLSGTPGDSKHKNQNDS